MCVGGVRFSSKEVRADAVADCGAVAEVIYVANIFFSFSSSLLF